MKYSFIAFFVYLLSLFFREERLPASWVESICERYSTSNIVLRCEGASFGLRRGVRLRKPKVYDRAKNDVLEPVVQAESIAVNHLSRTVRIAHLAYPRLPDSYYKPGYKEIPDPGIVFVLPKLPGFDFVLSHPSILGLEPTRVTGHVTLTPQRCQVRDLQIKWNNKEQPTALKGEAVADLAARLVRIEVEGRTTQRQIRPFVERLDITSALPYMDAFTEILEPVPARGVFTVDLRKGDFGMNLHLKPTMGRYNKVAMDRADGIIDVHTQIRGTNCNVHLDVILPEAVDLKGRKLSGRVTVDNTDNRVRLGFDAKSGFPFPDVLSIVDFIDPALVADLTCAAAPLLTCTGHTGTSAADKAYNDLGGTASLAAGSLFGFRFRDLTLDYRLKGDRLAFSDIRARGKDGGAVTGQCTLFLDDFEAEKAHFALSGAYRGGTLEELADFLKFETADRTGHVDADFAFTGPLNTNVLAHLDGHGRMQIRGGRLMQLKLFAGLTKELATHVPGVDYLTNLSDASGDFTVADGILTTTNVVVSGGLVSVAARGTYDIARDNLDFAAHVRLFRNDSLASLLVSPITWTLTKVLLEFRVKGSPDEPVWEYVSPFDKLSGLFGGGKEDDAPRSPRKERERR